MICHLLQSKRLTGVWHSCDCKLLLMSLIVLICVTNLVRWVTRRSAVVCLCVSFNSGPNTHLQQLLLSKEDELSILESAWSSDRRLHHRQIYRNNNIMQSNLMSLWRKYQKHPRLCCNTCVLGGNAMQPCTTLLKPQHWVCLVLVFARMTVLNCYCCYADSSADLSKYTLYYHKGLI